MSVRIIILFISFSLFLSCSKEVKIDIATAKNVAYTLGIVMSRLAGDYEQLLSKKNKEEVIQIQMDGGKL